MRHSTSRTDSALVYVLKGLIPYSRENLKLTFKPNAFFNELERISRKKSKSLRNAYYKARQDGLIEVDEAGWPRLTVKAKHIARPNVPKKAR